MASDTLMDIILTVAEDIADGMQKPQFTQYPWGSIFSWEMHPLTQVNFSLISSPTPDMEALKNWYGSNSRIYSKLDLDNTVFEATTDQVLLFIRTKSKIKTPFQPDYTISHFDLESRNLNVDVFSLTKAASRLYQGTKEEQDLVEKYLSATLHMRSGEIWLLEDLEQNIISSVVVGKVDDVDLLTIEYAQIHPNYASSELLKHLLEHVISHHGRFNDILIVTTQSNPLTEIAQNLEFVNVEIFNSYKLIE